MYLVVFKLSLPLSIDIERPSTQQLAIRRVKPVIEAYNIPVDIPVCKVSQKWPISGVSVKFCQVAA
jgi:hypothetical protein